MAFYLLKDLKVGKLAITKSILYKIKILSGYRSGQECKNGIRLDLSLESNHDC